VVDGIIEALFSPPTLLVILMAYRSLLHQSVSRWISARGNCERARKTWGMFFAYVGDDRDYH
jgi:hypothetical protein